MSGRLAYLLTAATAIALLSHEARAQAVADASTTPANAGTNGDDDTPPNDIVVTAQKRSERLQDVPVPVSVLNPETLVDRGQARVQDFFSTVPGLDLNSSGNGQSTLSIRGINTSPSTNPAVGIVVDDVPYGSSTSLGYGSRFLPDLDPAILERIEVLRGPQGTLYGASSIGGLLRYTMKNPSRAGWSGSAQADVSDADHGDVGFGLRGSVNVPVTAQVAVLASGFFRRDPGYVDNIATGKHDVNQVNNKGGYVSALWQPSDRLKIKASALLQNADGKGTAEVDVDAAEMPIYGDLLQNRVPDSGDYEIASRLYALNAVWDLGPVSLTSVTAYGISRYDGTIDQSPQRAALTQQFFDTPYAIRTNWFRTAKWSQEARLASDGHHVIDWTLGFFYTHESTSGVQIVDAVRAAISSLVGNLYSSSFPTTFEEKAGFADAIINFSSRLDVQLGGRYSANHQSYHDTDSGALYPGGDSTSALASDHAYTFQVAPQYKFSSNLMAYARVASGYRAGGPNPGALIGIPGEYRHDTTVNYELGAKGSAFQKMLNFDLSAYYIDWRNIQLALRDPVSGFTYFGNGNDAHSRGIEAAVELAPVTGLHLSGAASLNQATLAQSLPTGLFGSKGDRLPYAPKWSGNLSVDQDVPLSDFVKASVGGSFSYVGTRTTEFQNRVAFIRPVLPAYTTFDLRAGIGTGPWNINLFARNITDKRGKIGISSRTGNNIPTAPYAINYIEPRSIGLSVARRF